MRSRSNLLKAKSGNALMEFALLAPVFFMLITGMIEFVLYEYRSYALNHVVYEATRNLQTGEVQTSGNMAQSFQNAVCDASGPLIDCNDMVFDVRAFDAISDITFPEVVYDENGKPVNFVFQPGGANKYSVVRAAIPHHFVTPYMSRLMGLEGNASAILNSYAIVKNEPWS